MDSRNLPPRARSNRSLAPWLAVLGALALTACVQSEIINMRPDEAAPLSGKVSDVAVASGDIPLSRMGVYEKIGANRLIGQEIIARLVEDDHFDESGDTRITVRVTGFRLRSAANAVFWGGYTGVDRLAGEVDIQLGEDHTNYYTFELSARQEAAFKYSAKSRLRSLARALAEKISTLFVD